jgi:hypothetical protein
MAPALYRQNLFNPLFADQFYPRLAGQEAADAGDRDAGAGTFVF